MSNPETSPDSPAVGFAHPDYAKSLDEFGTPRFLPECRGWLLERSIPGSDLRDAIGCYPMFSCEDWTRLPMDIAGLGPDIVALSMVPEVLGPHDPDQLRQCFDRVIPFKEHFVADVSRPADEFVSRHHRKYARRALRTLRCEQHPNPVEFLDEWMDLHRTLVERHRITGLRAFSRRAFARQLNAPGCVVLRALHDQTTVGAQIWFQQNEVAYGHVLAFNSLGYETGAAYALYWFALNYFADKVRYCDFCGVSGVKDSESNGLSWFKEGWSTEKRTAYFCSRILDREQYDKLVEAAGMTGNSFFPAYRTGI